MSQNRSSGADGDSLWIFTVDSGAYEHVSPTDFASATPLEPTKGSMLCDAQGHVIEAHGTRTVYMRLGPEGQSVCADLRVTNVKSPNLRMGKLVKQGYTSSKQDRVQNVEGRPQRDVGRREEFSLGRCQSSHDGGRSSPC